MVKGQRIKKLLWTCWRTYGKKEARRKERRRDKGEIHSYLFEEDAFDIRDLKKFWM